VVHLYAKMYISLKKFGPSIHGKSLDRVYHAKVWTEYTWQKFGSSIPCKSLDRVYMAKSLDRVYNAIKKKENFFGMAGPGQFFYSQIFRGTTFQNSEKKIIPISRSW
jgi:hypothetical protein